MSRVESLGIEKLEAIHCYVHDLERSRRFYTQKLGFAEIAVSSPQLEQRGRQRSVAFRAGDCVVICSEPIGEGGRAWRWLRRHPDGVGTLVFRVRDIERAFRLLDARGGTPIDEIQTFEEDGGRLRTFSITTPLGNTRFRFVERRDYTHTIPGMVELDLPRGGRNVSSFHFDHITSNFETMAPALLWLEHVLGCEEYWNIEFHTAGIAPGRASGSGLRSRVMVEPESGVKFANNEPLRPFFRASQINIFHEDQRGDGVQHAAIAVDDIVGVVRAMRARGVGFLPTPAAYYDLLRSRIDDLGIRHIDEDIDTLRELGILVDGTGERSYLLQIFLQDFATMHGETEAGPFFFEIIQRKGDKGFGGGNFRALFESIERHQREEGR